MRERRASRSSPSTRTARCGAFDVFGLSFSTELGYTNMLTALDLAGHPAAGGRPGRRRPDRAGRRPRRVQPRADRRLPRRRRAGRRRAGRPRDHRGHPRVEGRGLARRPRRAAAAAGRVPAASTCRSSTTSTTCPTAGSSGSRPNRPGVPWRVHKHTVMDLDEWPYPKKPLVPLAETVHERYAWRSSAAAPAAAGSARPGMITRPVRERSITTIGDMVEDGLKAVRLRRGRPAVAVQRRPLRDRRRSPRAWPTGTRAPTSRCRCRRPGSTRSTSTWPTSSPATAAAPA